MPNWKKLITSGSNISQLNNDSGFITSYVNTTYSAGSGLQLSGTTFSVDVVDGTTQTTAANSRTTTSGRTYAIQFDESNNLVVNVPWSDTNTQATRDSLGLDTDDDVTFATINCDELVATSNGSIAGGNIDAGGVGRSANTTVTAKAGDGYRAGFEAYGNSQGTGYLYVGQSTTYGGGISYNGDNSPAFISGESADAITFFRRSAGTSSEVFHYMYSSDTVNFNGDIVAYHSSDKRLKTNILPIESALDKIDKLGGYTFDWIPTEEVHSNEGTDIGVIAQEIEEQFPELVTTRENGYKAVKYDKLVAVLLQGIKELRQEIRDCKASK